MGLLSTHRSRLATPILFVLLLALADCGGVASKHIATEDVPATISVPDVDKPNSYYYFLVSQLQSIEEDEKGSFKSLTQAIERDPNSPYLWGQKAYGDARFGNIDDALKDAEKALGKNPADVDALLLMGKLNVAKQQTQLAITYYRRALAIDPKSEEAYNLLARDELSLGDKNASLLALVQCVRELPESVSCLYYLGTIQLELGHLDEALKNFNLITELNPEQTRILSLIGEIYIKKQQYNKALDVFQQMIQANPSDLVSQIRIGLLYYQLKDTDRAIQEFLKVTQRFPDSDKVNYFLGLMFLEKGQFDDAYTYLDRIPHDSSFFREAFNRQILILRSKNELTRASELIDAKFKDKSVEYYQLKVSLALIDSDYKGSLRILDEGLRKFKEDDKLLFQHAVVLDKLDRWTEAKTDLQTLIAQGSKSPDVYNFLGYSMAERGEDLSKALEYVQKAVELAPEEGHVLDSLAWVYYKLNQADKALPLLLKAIKLEPTEPTILEHLGDVYFVQKDKTRARDFYERALKALKSLDHIRNDEQKQIHDIEQKLAEF